MNAKRTVKLTRLAITGGIVSIYQEGPKQFVVERFEADRGVYDRIEGFETFRDAREESLSYATE